MKKALMLAFCLLLAAGSAFAQGGQIGLYSDVYGTNCNVTDAAPGLVAVYVVHMYTIGSTAAQFSVDDVSWSGNAMTPLSEAVTSPYIKIGTCAYSMGGAGCSIAYGGCYSFPNMILTIQYFGTGSTPPCRYIRVMPDQTLSPPAIYVADCSDPPLLIGAVGGTAVINPDPTCLCDIPVEETSWGQIKSLYR